MSDPGNEKWAVLIGIDFYAQGNNPQLDVRGRPITFPHLYGCVADVNLVEQYLLDTMKVDKSRITKLLAPHPDSDSAQPSLDAADSPTYQNIVNALQSVPKRAGRGSKVYIHYSGHGARATTVFPTLKGKSGLDEVLVPMDVSRGGRYLRDLEMTLLLKDMEEAGLDVTVVLDSCHSGSATRRPPPERDGARDSSDCPVGCSDSHSHSPQRDQGPAADAMLMLMQFASPTVCKRAGCSSRAATRFWRPASRTKRRWNYRPTTARCTAP
jgi:hypothetical protein